MHFSTVSLLPLTTRFSGCNHFTFSFAIHLGYYKTHSDADSERLWPTSKLPSPSVFTAEAWDSSLIINDAVKGSAQSRRVRRSPDVREYFLVQSYVYKNQSQVSMKSDGEVTSGKYT